MYVVLPTRMHQQNRFDKLNTESIFCIDFKVFCHTHRTSQDSYDVCNVNLRTQKCWDCHLKSGVCHLYTVGPIYKSTVAKDALSNHLCLRSRCPVCSSYYEIQHEASRNQSARHQRFVQRPNTKRERATSQARRLLHVFCIQCTKKTFGRL